MPYSGVAPKSACRLRHDAPKNARYASDRGSTASADTSRFQSLSGGNIGQPASVGPDGAGAGTAIGVSVGVAGGAGAVAGAPGGAPASAEGAGVLPLAGMTDEGSSTALPPHAAAARRSARTMC